MIAQCCLNVVCLLFDQHCDFGTFRDLVDDHLSNTCVGATGKCVKGSRSVVKLAADGSKFRLLIGEYERLIEAVTSI